MKRAMLILAGFGYVMFLIAGLDTGLGVYRKPAYCFAAFACAVVAAVYVSKRQKLYWSIAAIIAIAGSLYGYHQNAQWRERLDRVLAQQTAGSAALDSVKVLVIAREAVRTNDTWLERAEFETPKQQQDGSWIVRVRRLPAEFGGDRFITIDATGKVTHYVRGL